MRIPPHLLHIATTTLGLIASVKSEQPEPGADTTPAQTPLIVEDFVCKHPHYQVQLVSTSPLLIYIKNFLTERELLHLKSVR